jgi:PBP1b-binding outer membrane lipoprotein LpoB
MQIIPKSYVILAVLLVFLTGCRNRNELPHHQENEQSVPQEKLRDSSNFHKSPESEMPGKKIPGRAREKSNSELDTLLPIKA